ncbi:hypothetical protein VF21_10295 [Pseudogymnoascus sp. 05NY08]|nr:hypothetical protein VF21_10295 [Pseudogymnoascus sp. 05NY08]
MHLLRSRHVLLAASWASAAHAKHNTSKPHDFDALQYVNPLIGTINGGHAFAGATLPFGMAKSVADVNSADNKQGGFASDDSDITGFSHMHDSGTGGGASLGNFPIFPQSGCPGDSINNCKFTKIDRASQRIYGSVEARPGYFAISLNTSIHTEMTVTNHTSLYRFRFPDNQTSNATYPNQTSAALPLSPLFLVDLTDLPDSRINGSIAVDPTTGRITGNGTFQPSFGVGSYNAYFCADFSGATIRDTGVWMNNRAGSEPKHLSVTADGVNNPPLPAGAWTQFHAPTSKNEIFVRVGLSFISEAKACQNAELEIPDFGFKKTLAAADDAWRSKLSVVKIDAGGISDDIQTVFWSGMYKSMMSPQDYTGENMLWESDEPYYDSYYCIFGTLSEVFTHFLPLQILELRPE